MFSDVTVPKQSVCRGFSEHPHILSHFSHVTGRPRDLLKVKARPQNPLIHGDTVPVFSFLDPLPTKVCLLTLQF